MGGKNEGWGKVMSQKAGEVNKDQIMTVSLIRNLDINLGQWGAIKDFKLVTNMIKFTF